MCVCLRLRGISDDDLTVLCILDRRGCVVFFFRVGIDFGGVEVIFVDLCIKSLRRI